MLKRREKTSHRQRQNNCSANNHQSLYLHTHRTPSSKQESKWKALSHVRLFVTPWTIQSMELSRPEYWSGYPFPSPGDLPNPGIKLGFPALQADSLPTELSGKPRNINPYLIGWVLLAIVKRQFSLEWLFVMSSLFRCNSESFSYICQGNWQAHCEFHELHPDLENLTFTKISFTVKNSALYHLSPFPTMETLLMTLRFLNGLQQPAFNLITANSTLEITCENSREYILVPIKDPPGWPSV